MAANFCSSVTHCVQTSWCVLKTLNSSLLFLARLGPFLSHVSTLMCSSSAVHTCTFVVDESCNSRSSRAQLEKHSQIRQFCKQWWQGVLLTLFTHMLLFEQANAYKTTTPELTFQPDTAIIKVCQKSDKTWCYITRWHTLAYMPGSFSDSQTLSIFNQSNVPLYCPTHDQKNKKVLASSPVIRI